jgi:hypothetical protein
MDRKSGECFISISDGESLKGRGGRGGGYALYAGGSLEGKANQV